MRKAVSALVRSVVVLNTWRYAHSICRVRLNRSTFPFCQGQCARISLCLALRNFIASRKSSDLV